MGLLRRLLETLSQSSIDQRSNSAPPLATSMAAPPSVPGIERSVSVKLYGRHLAHVPELDLMGQFKRSPNQRFILIFGSIGAGEGDRDGRYAIIEGAAPRVFGKAERPSEGAVADTGAFALNDWLHGPGLSGRFIAGRPDGTVTIVADFTANLSGVAISEDGRYAVCQTLRSPDSADSNIVVLFDLDEGKELARVQPKCVTARDFKFDLNAGRLHLIGQDGDRETDTFSGEMADREGWTLRRIDIGDLNVIAEILKKRAGSLDPALVQRMRHGLSERASTGDNWMRARAFRLEGELCEMLGNPGEALVAYEAALGLDPQVGVARRADKLRRAARPADAARAPKISRQAEQARRLGISHEVLDLEAGGPKLWRVAEGPFVCIEEAALAHYRKEGWTGVAAEGGLMLTLIKAASFERLAVRNADTFVEALYAQNVAFPEDRFDPARLVSTVARATEAQLKRNWAVISATTGNSPAYYPSVRWEHVTELFSVLGPKRLAAVAQVFATAPYDLRAGWPDLTMWRGDDLRFVEVKSPSDRMHVSQARLISTVLVPLGFQTMLAEVRPRLPV